MPVGEARLIKSEMTVRNLRLTREVFETRRSMIRWLALSIGIINPGETRQSSIAVLDAMIHFQFKLNKDPTVEEMSRYIASRWSKINEKTLRYHLLRMKNMNILDHSKAKYYFTWPDVGERYSETEWLDSYFDGAIAQIKGNVSKIIKELRQR